jgi:peptidyl-prolyl cis-trans isomerase A (cyclophilin A)
MNRLRTIATLVLALGLQAATLPAQTNNAAERPLPGSPHVQIETELGNIEVELDAKHAPVTVSNFLRYVAAGHYTDGRFFRTVTLDNQPTNNIKIQVVQVEASPAAQRKVFPAIPLERTRDTGLRHRDGTLSMARYGPDTATDSFSIVIGDQPEMDFGGKRQADGQGFAAFGQVVKGMDVVRKIQAAPAQGQQLRPAIRILRVTRLN